jgi:two-component sensor histidine kinase
VSLVEQPPGGNDTETATLRYRLDQQGVLADFGREALGCRDLDRLLDVVAVLSARGMDARFSKVLEHRADRHSFFLRAGVGWAPGIVGVVEVGDGPETPAGHALATGEPVIANQLAPGQRFCTPEFMKPYGIERAINVTIPIDGVPFGVLEVDSSDPRRFDGEDITFLQAFANLLGLAIGRIQVEQALDRANRHQQLLTREASHRVKNSLAMVSALLGLRMRGIDDPALQQVLIDTQGRIQTIARAHDLLWRGDRVGTVPLDAMICELAEELVEQAPGHRLDCAVAPIELHADVAIPLGLMVTELVTNALKYAYGPEGGEIAVLIEEQQDGLALTVRDRGRGLPPGIRFDGKGQGSLGSRIVASTARQLRGKLEVEDCAPGTAIRFVMSNPPG